MAGWKRPEQEGEGSGSLIVEDFPASPKCRYHACDGLPILQFRAKSRLVAGDRQSLLFLGLSGRDSEMRGKNLSAVSRAERFVLYG